MVRYVGMACSGRGYVTIEERKRLCHNWKKEDVMSQLWIVTNWLTDKGRYRAARAAKNNNKNNKTTKQQQNNKTTTTKQWQQNNNNKQQTTTNDNNNNNNNKN